MFRALSRAAAVCFFLAPGLAAAEPINLKLSFFTSDRARIYQQSVKPFVDAVNSDGRGIVHIEVFFSGAISGEIGRQPQIVSDGSADLAMIIPGQTPERFYDTSVLELPGLFHDSREGTRVFTRLIGDGAFAGYQDLFVVSAIVSGAESIHSRKRIDSLADLNGLRIRVNNRTEAQALQKFGSLPVLLSINQTTEAISSGTIDGATIPPLMLSEFGVGRVATHHFMMGLGGAAVALVMNRQKLESLPPDAQSIIRKYSGDWSSSRTADFNDAADREALDSLVSDPRRAVVFPDAADAGAIEAVYRRMTEDYAGISEHNRGLLARVRGELAKLSAGE